jgi:hypothetical protein
MTHRPNVIDSPKRFRFQTPDVLSFNAEDIQTMDLDRPTDSLSAGASAIARYRTQVLVFTDQDGTLRPPDI